MKTRKEATIGRNGVTCSFIDKYGNPSAFIWISKRRQKFVIEFKEAQMLVINGEELSFNEILSCSIENVPLTQLHEQSTSEPYILLIRTSNKTNLLIALTIWGEYNANAIYKLVQKVIKSKRA